MTSLRHLRSSTANKRPDPTAMVDGQLAMNYDIASPGLFFKDDNGTLVKVGPVHVGTTAPNVSPAAGGTAGNSIGEQWLDTTGGVYVLKVWDGSAWRSESGTFVDVSGDTMTGALTMANQQAVRFSETTANGSNYIALQATAALASNKTITLPDTTGTIVTTGDTGTVTSTMIENGTILNADVNASAAIAGTKVSPDFGSQTIVTTGVHSAAAGSAAAPSIAFTGDLNTGIYSPGADQLAVSTGGTGRLFVDSSGNVGIGTSSPGQVLDVIAGNDAGILIRQTTSNIGFTAGNYSELGLGSFVRSAGIRSIQRDLPTNNNSADLAFFATTNANVYTERLRITSEGNVGIGTSSPSNQLHVAQDFNGNTAARVSNSNTGGSAYSSLYIQGSSVTTELSQNSSARTFLAGANGFYINTGASSPLAFAQNGTARLYINSSGNVGIGTSSPESQLNVGVGTARLRASEAGITTAISIVGGDYNQQNNAALILSGGQANDNRVNSWVIQSLATGTDNSGVNDLRFCTGSYSGTAYGISEKLRIDSSGRLLVGTTSASGGTDNTTKFVVNGGMRSFVATGAGNVTFTPNYTFQDGLYAIAYRVSGQDKGFIGYVSCINGNATVTTLTDRGTSAPSVVAGPQIQFPIPGGNFGKVVSITLLTGLV